MKFVLSARGGWWMACGLLLVAGCAPLEWQPPAEPQTETSIVAAPASTAPSQVQIPAPAATQKAEDYYSTESYRLLNKPDEIVAVLNNGLTIIVRRIPSPVVSVQGLVRTGSVYEGRCLGGGLSHLLEHLVAGGSCERRSEADNRDMLQRLGGNSNAFTSNDSTVFFVNTTTDHLDEAANLVTGWLYGAKITPEEYAREYEVVQRELEKDLGEADWVFYQMTQRVRYLFHPAGIPVVGYQAVIQGLSRDDVYAYYKYAYVPQNMVFSVAGNVDPEAMVAAIRKYSVGVQPGRIPDKCLPADRSVAAPRSLVATFPKLGQARLELAFPSVRDAEQDMYALDLLAAVLGMGESSMLVQELRDKQELASVISASDNTPDYVKGTFAIDMELAPDKIKAATDAVMAILQKIKAEPIAEERIARAKAMIKASEAMSQQTAEAVASAMTANFLSTGAPDDTEAERVSQVTAAQLQAVAIKYLDCGKLLTTVLLPAEAVQAGGLPAAEKFLRQAGPATQSAAVKPASASGAVTRVELDNGTILLLKRVATSPVVAIRLYSQGGLTTEDAASNGLGNLVMATVSRGTKERSAEQLANFFDSVGGAFEAKVNNNSWLWGASALKADFPRMLEVFADIVNQPAFPDGEVANIKKRLAADIESEDSSWFGGGMRYFRSQFFGPSNSPYRFTMLGTAKNLNSFTAEQVRQFYKDKILPARRVLAIYGDIDIAEARTLAAQYLGKGSKVGTGMDDPRSAAAAFIKSRYPAAGATAAAALDVKAVQVQKWDNPECAVFIGFDTDEVIGDPASEVLTMAGTLTGGYGYPTGYIFETLRGLGFSYEAGSQNWLGQGPKMPGAFWTYAVCDAKNVNSVVDLVLANVARLQGSPQDMDLQWFERAKILAAAADAMDNETASAQADTAALDELWGLGYAYHEGFARRIAGVTVAQVQDLARLRTHNCIVTISTPKPEVVTIKPGERKYVKFEPVDLTPKGIQHDTPAK